MIAGVSSCPHSNSVRAVETDRGDNDGHTPLDRKGIVAHLSISLAITYVVVHAGS